MTYLIPWMFVACNLTVSVLLFDEADIFLEQRSTANLERNILVSGISKHVGIARK